MLCLDLDEFKNVNDTLGHPVGDALLRAVAARLRTCVREADTVARLGGDEFAVLQMDIDRPEDAGALAQRIIEVLNEPFDLGGHQVVIGSSIGIAMAPMTRAVCRTAYAQRRHGALPGEGGRPVGLSILRSADGCPAPGATPS